VSISEAVKRAIDVSFANFVAKVSPQYAVVPPHLQRLYELVQETKRRPVRVTLSIPPRHGKTVTLAHALAWRSIYTPSCLNVYATYNEDLAEHVSTAVRKMVTSSGWSLARGKVLDWQTQFGGGLKATSVGGGITGRGVNGGLIVIDDAVKGREEAESLRSRDRTWNWFKDDVMSRAQGGASVIVVNTRWHEDDIIGRLQADGIGERWIHINLPAIGDEHGAPIDEKIHSELARPLWTGIDELNPTEAGSRAWYAKARARGEYGWWSLYQGVPRSLEARMFALDPPRFEAFVWEGKRGCIVLDPAATANTNSDYSALGAHAMDGYAEQSKMSVVEVIRVQAQIPAVVRLAYQMQQRYRLPIGVESVGGFKAVPQMLREMEPKLKVIDIHPLGDKRTRAIPFSDAWQSGRVSCPLNATWVADYLAELRSFTGVGDLHDDQVDMSAHAWNLLYKEKPSQRSGWREQSEL
jgi:predicted phage terminase large subunit-like protein